MSFIQFQLVKNRQSRLEAFPKHGLSFDGPLLALVWLVVFLFALVNSSVKVMPFLRKYAPELLDKLLLVLPRIRLAIAEKAGWFGHLSIKSKLSKIRK